MVLREFVGLRATGGDFEWGMGEIFGFCRKSICAPCVAGAQQKDDAGRGVRSASLSLGDRDDASDCSGRWVKGLV